MKGRLNSFQRSMLQWSDLHAYNAVHVVRIPGETDVPRMSADIHRTLADRGLTWLKLDRSRNAYEYAAGPDGCEIQVLTGEDPMSSLVAAMERELNRPFPYEENRFCAFRFLIAPAGDSFFLGLVYFHPVADAESVVVLLREIVNRHRRGDSPAFAESLDLYPDGRSRLLRRHPGVVLRRLLGLPGQAARLRRSLRAGYRDVTDMTNGFVFFTVDPDQLAVLVGTAKSWRTTVNDLFLALLMKSLSPCARERFHARKRNRMSVGCIVNTRRQNDIDSRRTFGLFLGSFLVTHAVPEHIPLRRLAVDVAGQTERIKRRRLFLGTAMELGLARFALRFFSPRRRHAFYPKNWPLWGGITNMNLNALWKPSEDGVPLDYFRGVSTGPITPLVLSVTTSGDRANIGLSFRTTVFSTAAVMALKDRFLEQLGEIGRDS